MFARRFTGQPPPVLFQDFFVYGRRSGNYPETRLEDIEMAIPSKPTSGGGIASGLRVTREQFSGEPMKRLLVCVSRQLSLHALDGGQPISRWHQALDIGIAPMMSGCIPL